MIAVSIETGFFATTSLAKRGCVCSIECGVNCKKESVRCFDCKIMGCGSSAAKAAPPVASETDGAPTQGKIACNCTWQALKYLCAVSCAGDLILPKLRAHYSFAYTRLHTFSLFQLHRTRIHKRRFKKGNC